jgi:hypothetical protein
MGIFVFLMLVMLLQLGRPVFRKVGSVIRNYNERGDVKAIGFEQEAQNCVTRCAIHYLL